MREKWSSGIGFILAGIGSAVGIGNVWRFPYLVGVNGGGAFLIPYLIAVFLFGLPLMIIEFALGRHLKTSVVPAFTAIKKSFKIAGFFLVFIMVMILSYYLVITGWILAFFFYLITGSNMTFSMFTDSYYPLLFFLISGGVVFFVVRAGIKEGIEKLSKLLIPLLFIMLLMLLVFSLFLPGTMAGVQFYLRPDFSKLFDPFVWTAAFGQAFFSLSVGTGIMLTYGSYMKEDDTEKTTSWRHFSVTEKSAALIALFTVVAAILGGFVIFPIVFSFGLNPSSGMELAFITLPIIFEKMSFGSSLGAAFFLLLFIAAISAAISLLEVPVASLIDLYGLDRKKATTVVSLIIMLIGLLPALSYTAFKIELFGKPIFDLFDFAFGTIGVIIAGLFFSLIAGWFMSPEILVKEIRGYRGKQSLFKFIIRFFIPFILLIILLRRII